MLSPAIESSPPFNFLLPDRLKAKEPAEVRGIARDSVKLLVIDRHQNKTYHTRFNQLASYLRKNDLLVFNSSRTLPAVLKGYTSNHHPVEIRLAEHLPDDTWLALIMMDNKPATNIIVNTTIDFNKGLTATVLSRDSRIAALWKIKFSKTKETLLDAIYSIGQPIRYEYISEPWALDYYQTVYAKEPGSAEMPSAGRAFTWRMIFDLKRRGINTAYITLHTGLSSYLNDEVDAMHFASEEEYAITESAAKKIADAKEKGGRIIAVGTTVVKALE
jgi:S-adenosylmethionine:tRNA ribosyltransferase-isomerase